MKVLLNLVAVLSLASSCWATETPGAPLVSTGTSTQTIQGLKNFTGSLTFNSIPVVTTSGLQALTNKSVNGITLQGSGTLQTGTGGTLGSAAFTLSSAYDVSGAAAAAQAFAIQRANHTGAQTASTISDFTSSVNTLIGSGTSAASSTAHSAEVGKNSHDYIAVILPGGSHIVSDNDLSPGVAYFADTATALTGTIPITQVTNLPTLLATGTQAFAAFASGSAVLAANAANANNLTSGTVSAARIPFGTGTGQVAQGSLVVVGTGSYQRTLVARSLDSVSVKDFGALGNGSNDDTAAFNAAIAAVSGSGGGEIDIPAGIYKVTSTISVTGTNIQISGCGRASCIMATGDYGDIFHFAPTSDPAAGAYGMDGCGVKNLFIESAAVRTSGYAINTKWTSSFAVNRVWLGKLQSDDNPIPKLFRGINMENQDTCRLCNVISQTIGTALRVTGAAHGGNIPFNGFDGWASECEFWGARAVGGASQTTETGVILEGGNGGFDIVKCQVGFFGDGMDVGPGDREIFSDETFFDSNVGEGLHVKGCKLLVLTNVWAASNTSNGILIDDGAIEKYALINGAGVICDNSGFGIITGLNKVQIDGAIAIYNNGSGSIQSSGADVNIGDGVLGFASAKTANVDLFDGLVSYWSLDEVSGTRRDSSPSHADLTASGGVGSTQGILGNAADFVGTQYLQESGTLNLASAISISMWVKGTGSDPIGSVGNRDDGGSGPDYRLIVIGSTVTWQVRTDNENDVTEAFPNDGTWHHVVGTYDGTTVAVYVDGVAGGTTTGSGPVSNLPVLMGCTNYSGYPAVGGVATGGIDETAIFNRALSAADVLSLYNSGLAFSPYRVIYANTSGTSISITGTIGESQVTNLVSDLSSKLPLTGGTITGNLSITGTNNTLPNQLASGTSSIMTRSLSDARYAGAVTVISGTLVSGSSTINNAGLSGVHPWAMATDTSTITNAGSIAVSVSGTTATIKSSNVLDARTFNLFFGNF